MKALVYCGPRNIYGSDLPMYEGRTSARENGWIQVVLEAAA